MHVIIRLARTAVPLLLMTATGMLQAQPQTIWLLPVLAAFGKGVRDTFPDTRLAKYFPF